MKLKKVPKIITLPIELTPSQQMVDDCGKRFITLRQGRRGGKTKYGLFWAASEAATPNSLVWYIAPTYNQAKEIAWRELMQLLPDHIVKRRNESSLTVKLINNSELALKGSDNPDPLRGRKLKAVVLDEAAYQQEYIWVDVLQAALADLEGRALFISTPKGKNWFYKLCMLGESGKDKDWGGFHFTIYDNPHISRQEIERLRATVSDATWKQEFLAEFMDNIGVVYGEFDEKRNIFNSTNDGIYYQGWPMVRSVDWGLDDDTGAVWQHIDPKNGRIFTTHEHSQNGWSVPKQAEAINRITYPRVPVVGNDVLSFDSFKTEPTSMVSIASQFNSSGLRCVPSNKNIDVGIELVKRCLVGSNGEPWVKISDRCIKLIEALKSWEHGKHEPDVAAAFRYGLTHIYRKKLSDIFSTYSEKPFVVANDNSLLTPDGNRRIIRKRTYQNISWDFDNGVPS